MVLALVSVARMMGSIILNPLKQGKGEWFRATAGCEAYTTAGNFVYCTGSRIDYYYK